MKAINHLDEVVREHILEHHPFFSTKVDGYLKWLPLYSIFILDAAGLKTKHNWKQQLSIVGSAYTITTSLVEALKKQTKEMRPNFSPKENSFPSSHTAICFLGAEIIHQELKDNYPVSSYLPYGIAATTGILRLYKNKHWVSDVVCGAAFGIITAKIIYGVFKKWKGSNKKDTSLDKVQLV